jgi:predicted nucleic acid-binding protein
VIGTVRILVEAKRKGILNGVHEALKQLKEAGYWIHDDIVHQALKRVGEE